VNIKAFFVDALSSALELGIGTPDDVLRHVTPAVLAAHLPRPLWARLFTACLGAPRVDAQLVVETIGVPNLCEHVPATIIWACVAELAARSLGKKADVVIAPVAAVAAAPSGPIAKQPSGPARSVLAPPPEERPSAPAIAPSAPVAIGPSIPPTPTPAVNQPLADLITELESDERPIVARPRSPTSQRFRQTNTAVGRLGANARRPQAAAVPAPAPASRPRRDATEVGDGETETGIETSTSTDFRSREIPVDDSQLVDWKTDTAGTAIGDDDFSDIGRKR
jgi:hypothetical protein